MPNLTIGKLNDMYSTATSQDSDLYAEQRSNILLIAGEHYNRKTSNHLERIRTSSQLSNEQKIRLTKNHIYRIIKIYTNNILNAAPDAHCVPSNPTENSDIKAAELHNSVLDYIKRSNHLDKKKIQFAADYCGIGEVFVKVFWDESKGELIQMEPQFDPMTNTMQPISMMSGELVIERFYGFNMFREAGAKSLDEAEWIGFRKMVDIKELKTQYAQDETLLSYITDGNDETYTIFQGDSGKYEDSKNKCMIREYYFRPCMTYPKGYYYITTSKGILHEGELPGGIFPIVYAGFDEIQTSPRFRSIIKQLRPYQAEINRAASKEAEHQVTLGDDKIIYQAGSKIADGESMHGVRGIKISGPAPTILPGRNGAQYTQHIQNNITEMYQVAMVAESLEETNGQIDAYTMLFRNMKEKRKFSIYIRKYELFIKEVYEKSLELFRLHAPEQMIVPIVGRNEIVNIPEYKNMSNINYQIKVVESTEDIESQMGKQLTLTNVLQYASAQLSPSEIAKIVKSMPFVNKDSVLKDLTLYDDVINSYILSIERGTPFNISRYISQDLIIDKLTKRISETDYMYLKPEIQQLFDQKLQEHEAIKVQQMQDASKLNSQFIPTGGFLVGVDFYINPDPKNPTKTRRARVPYESLSWLLDRLQAQGLSQDSLYNMQEANLQDMSQIAIQNQSDQQRQQELQNVSSVMQEQVAPQNTDMAMGANNQPVY